MKPINRASWHPKMKRKRRKESRERASILERELLFLEFISCIFFTSCMPPTWMVLPPIWKA